MPRAAKPQPEPPKPLTPLEEATAEYERAQGALARAEANLEEVKKRQRETATAYEAAAKASGAAAEAMADDPGASALLDDSIAEMGRLEHRAKALEKQTLPTARAAVETKRGEMEMAREAYLVQARREAIRTVVLPTDRRLVEALAAAVQALHACRKVRREFSARGLQPKNMTGTWSEVPASIIPTELANLTRAKVQQSTVYGSQPIITFPQTGGDPIGDLCRSYSIDPATIPEVPAAAEPGEQS